MGGQACSHVQPPGLLGMQNGAVTPDLTCSCATGSKSESCRCLMRNRPPLEFLTTRLRTRDPLLLMVVVC